MHQGKRRIRSAWVEPDLRPAAVVGWHSPLGELTVAASDEFVLASSFDQRSLLEDLARMGFEAAFLGAGDDATQLANEARDQLAEYFDSQRVEFELPLHHDVQTEYARAVMEEVTYRVPFGTTATYGEIGERASRPRSARAVGNLLSSCPFSILVPCHRIVHAHGSEDAERYPGEAGVFSRKLWLLEFERGRVRTRRKVSVSATG